MSATPEKDEQDVSKDELNPSTDDDVVEGHGVEEDDAGDAAEEITITGICL